MIKRYLWNRPDGGCSIQIFTNGTSEANINSAIASIKEKYPVLSGVVPFEVLETDMDNPLSFGREVWDHGAKFNMAKGRIIKTSQVRAERDKRFPPLDVQYIRADEQGNAPEKARIAGVKTLLRNLPADIQPDLDAITTPAALEAYQPTWPS